MAIISVLQSVKHKLNISTVYTHFICNNYLQSLSLQQAFVLYFTITLSCSFKTISFHISHDSINVCMLNNVDFLRF